MFKAKYQMKVKVENSQKKRGAKCEDCATHEKVWGDSDLCFKSEAMKDKTRSHVSPERRLNMWSSRPDLIWT